MKRPILCLAGPTASGKSAAAMALARQLAPHVAVEIISVDSALVYRGMDIGTAKPTTEERREVPHHLIDIRDPLDAYSAAAFAADAIRLIGEIRQRRAQPVLVGGTMLYFKALWHGLDAMPEADAQVRIQLESQARSIGWPAMHAELARVDPVTAARLAPGDSQRIQRALEVWQVSGRALSSFHTSKSVAEQQDWTRAYALVSLEPASRAWLHARIGQRLDAMLAAGFVDEVRSLRARGDLTPDLPSMRCVGYRQAWQALDNGEALNEWRERAVAATRQLAKRQLTWLRSFANRTVVACDAPDAIDATVAHVRRLWGLA